MSAVEAIEEVHNENQAFSVYCDAGCRHDGVQPTPRTATIFRSIFACSTGLANLDSNRDAYPHAHEGIRRCTDDDVYSHACRGAHRESPPDASGPPRHAAAGGDLDSADE